MPIFLRIGIFFRSKIIILLYTEFASSNKYYDRGGSQIGGREDKNIWKLNKRQFKKILKIFDLPKEEPNNPEIRLARYNTGEYMDEWFSEPVKAFRLILYNGDEAEALYL